MIINTLKNISLYANAYTHLIEAVNYIQTLDLTTLSEGKNEVSDTLYVVKIIGDKKSDFEGILEIHKDWIDIHIPLTDDEIVAFKEISECLILEKEYDDQNDYALYRESDISQVTLSKGYFAIIDTTMAHMAMLGEGKIEKLVIKVRVK